MFERLQKPFLTVETGEAYQPIRLQYQIHNLKTLIEKLNKTECLKSNQANSTWDWFWRHECSTIDFKSIDSFKPNPERPIRLGTVTLRDNTLFINLPSFKRACLAAPFFHELFSTEIASISKADFVNKVFGVDERLPHGFTELFNDQKLDSIIHERVTEYENMQKACEEAESADEALRILSDYTQRETQKRLPYAERYEFHNEVYQDSTPDVIYLSFYIFLRGREMVAIKRWFGNPNYSLSNVADEAIEEIFGGVGLDILE